MGVEVRKALVWAIAAVSVASAMLLTSTGGSLPRLGSDVPRLRATAAEPAPGRAVDPGASVQAGARPAASSH